MECVTDGYALKLIGVHEALICSWFKPIVELATRNNKECLLHINMKKVTTLFINMKYIQESSTYTSPLTKSKLKNSV